MTNGALTEVYDVLKRTALLSTPKLYGWSGMSPKSKADVVEAVIGDLWLEINSGNLGRSRELQKTRLDLLIAAIISTGWVRMSGFALFTVHCLTVCLQPAVPVGFCGS